MDRPIESSLPVFDRNELVGRMMGNASMAERLIRKFLDQLDDDCDLLESTVRLGAKDDVASHAHRLKGTARTMATPRLVEIAAELEHRARTDATSELLGLVDRIRASSRELDDATRTAFEHANALEGHQVDGD